MAKPREKSIKMGCSLVASVSQQNRWYPPHRDPSAVGLYGRVKVGNPGCFQMLYRGGWMVGLLGDCLEKLEKCQLQMIF